MIRTTNRLPCRSRSATSTPSRKTAASDTGAPAIESRASSGDVDAPRHPGRGPVAAARGRRTDRNGARGAKLFGWWSGPGLGGFEDFLRHSQDPPIGFAPQPHTLSIVGPIIETGAGALLVLGLLTARGVGPAQDDDHRRDLPRDLRQLLVLRRRRRHRDTNCCWWCARRP